MAFQNSLGNLLTDSDERNTLWHALLQSLQDHGGKIQHLNNLLTDAKNEGRVVGELAKLIVGNIWKLAEKPIDLGLTENDFRDADFLRKYPGIVLQPYEFSESKPKGPCTYMLHHFRRPRLFNEIVGGVFDPKYDVREHAGWRELVAYVSHIQSADICGCDIVAAGSRLIPVEGGERGQNNAFPIARSYMPNSISVAWRGVERADVERFGGECFYLVRVY